MAPIWEEIELKIRARYPYLYLITHEEGRVAAKLKRIGEKLDRNVYRFSQYNDFVPPLDSGDGAPLERVAALKEPAIVMLNDYHDMLTDSRTVRQFKDLRDEMTRLGHVIVLTAPVLRLPVELEKMVAVIDVPLPDARELKSIFSQMCRGHKLDIDSQTAELFGRSATGLTAEEAMLIYSRMFLEPERITAGDTSPVIEEKRRLVAAEGVLEFYDRRVDLSDVGGLHALKGWLKQRESAFEEKARAFGLPEPKGMLLLGVQGCGKSLTAKAVSSHWRLPLVQMDLGAAFSSQNGPEEAIRRSLKLLEAMSPVVVWIDEIEKAFAGSKSATGDAAIHRIFGHFITWLQEKDAPVFVVATANGVESLPPELLRKGRFDELFFVDLPDEHERREVLNVHLGRRNVKPDTLALDELGDQMRNFTGAEIEQVVVDGLYNAFAAGRKPETADFISAARTLAPIYNTYEEDIKALRDWCRERTRNASIDTTLSDYFQQEEEGDIV